MFLFRVLGLCFEGVRDSLLLLIYCSFFVCFGVWNTTLLRSNLSLVLAFFGFVVFFVGALLFVFLLVWCFLWVLVPFNSRRHLGIVFLDCSVLMLPLLLHVLAARLSAGVFGLLF